MKLYPGIITSRNNPLVKWAATLSDKKGRTESGAFIVEGLKLTYEAIKAGLPVTYIFLTEKKYEHLSSELDEMLRLPKYEKTEIVRLSDSAFEKISTEKAPEGVISVIKYLDFFSNMDIIYKEEFFLQPEERALALYSVRDAGNLGAVIRSAVAFGVDHIIVSSDSADVYNPKTIRGAMGSLFKIKISKVSDFSSFVFAARANGRRVFSAELTDGAVSVSELDLKKSDILIIGNEGHGICQEISALTDGSVYIPISDKTESLNASVAAAIFMWEQNKL